MAKYNGEIMTLKDVIKYTSVFLGRKNVTEYLEDDGTADDLTLKTVDTLTRLANMVIRELNDGFIPMTKTETLSTENNKLYFSAFSENVTEILSVTTENGKTPLCKFHTQYVEINQPSVIVEYKFLPPIYGLDDQVGYKEKEISAVVIAYGVASEFCLTEKNFDESMMWHDRYADAINRLVKPKNATVKRRSFF